jgi:hypothetical protein
MVQAKKGVRYASFCALWLVALQGIAQETAKDSLVSSGETLGRDWKQFQLAFADHNILHRIAAVDIWLEQHQSVLQTLAKAEEARVQSTKANAVSVSISKEGDTDQNFLTELNALRQLNLEPEERIRRIDELLSQNPSRIDVQEGISLFSQSRTQAANSDSARFANPDPQSTPLTRKSQLTKEISDVVTQANSLSPEARILAVDAALPDIIKKQNELSKITPLDLER